MKADWFIKYDGFRPRLRWTLVGPTGRVGDFGTFEELLTHLPKGTVVPSLHVSRPLAGEVSVRREKSDSADERTERLVFVREHHRPVWHVTFDNGWTTVCSMYVPGAPFIGVIPSEGENICEACAERQVLWPLVKSPRLMERPYGSTVLPSDPVRRPDEEK